MTMKRFTYIFAFIASFALLSCNPDENGFSEVRTTPVTIDVANDYPVPNPAVDMEIFDRKVQASPDGVSVNVTSVGENYVRFSCRPGSRIASYAINLVPLSLLYNEILENDGVGAPWLKVEDVVLKSIFGGAFSGTALNEALLQDEWKNKEFDWINTEYAQYEILPATQYVIITVGCYEEEASINSAAEVNIVYFETPSQPSLNAALTLKPVIGYTAYSVTHQPNSSTSTFTYYSNEKSMIDEYADIFGDRMLRDFVRTAMGSLDATDESLLSVYRSFGSGVKVDPNFVITHLAVAMDRNGTPSDLVRFDFSLKQVPEDAPDGTAEIIVKQDALSAMYAEYDVYMCKNTNAVFYRTLTLEDAQPWMDSTEEQRKELAQDIYANGGYGVSNPNCNLDNEEASDFHMTVMENFLPKPDTDYVIAYVVRNRYMQLSDVKFTPFRSKMLVTDRPEDCKSNLSLEFKDVMKGQFTYSFTYDPDNTANFFFILVDPVQQHKDEDTGVMVKDYDVPADNASRSAWMDFFFSEKAQDSEQVDGYATYMNNWGRSLSGSDKMTLSGFDPGSYYRYAYISIDMNGVVSDVRFAEVTTLQPQAGPDPQMSMDCTYNASDKTWTVCFKTVKDCDEYKRFIGDEGTLYMDRLGTDNMYAYEFYNHWDTWIYAHGIISQTEVHTETIAADKDIIALCVPLGIDENGHEVVGKMQYCILTKEGQKKYISDYYPAYVEK